MKSLEKLKKLMIEQEKKDICKKEFHDARDNHLEQIKLTNKKLTDFLQIKLGFVAFVGIIFTIVFNKKDIFSDNFFIYLLIVTFLVFLLLIDDFWNAFKNHERALKSFERDTIITNIRHTAAVNRGKFAKYGEQVEKLAKTENIIFQSMQADESIEDIIKKVASKIEWKIDFVLWSVLMLSIPILFLFETWKLL